jgi:hypothetical protein
MISDWKKRQLTPAHQKRLAYADAYRKKQQEQKRQRRMAEVRDAIGTPLVLTAVTAVTSYCDKCDTKQYCRRQRKGHKRCEVTARATAQRLARKLQ